jgi:hypothetical protein
LLCIKEIKGNTVISLDLEKAFDNIQQTFIAKPLEKLGLQGNFLDQIKGVYKSHTVNIILNGERQNFLP